MKHKENSQPFDYRMKRGAAKFLVWFGSESLKA